MTPGSSLTNKHAETNHGQVRETGWTVSNNVAFTVIGDES